MCSVLSSLPLERVGKGGETQCVCGEGSVSRELYCREERVHVESSVMERGESVWRRNR